MMELGATVCRPRRPRCGECPLRQGCAGPDALPPPARPRGERFEASDRWARGRLLAALVAGEDAAAAGGRSAASGRWPASSATAWSCATTAAEPRLP